MGRRPKTLGMSSTLKNITNNVFVKKKLEAIKEADWHSFPLPVVSNPGKGF